MDAVTVICAVCGFAVIGLVVIVVLGAIGLTLPFLEMFTEIAEEAIESGCSAIGMILLIIIGLAIVGVVACGGLSGLISFLF